MVKKTTQKFSRIFAKPGRKRGAAPKVPMTDKEIEEIRRKFNITPKDPNDKHGFPSAYEKGM